jgi:uncharacterized protein YbjT (DUF2867 family)
MMQEPILVTGATGTLGREVVARLLAGGHGVRVMSRRPRPAGDTKEYEWAVADLTIGHGVAEAMAGVRTIVHCASGSSGQQKEADITRTLVEAARRAGSPHLVYISIINIDLVPLAYYRGKLASEKLIEESGIPFTILRAAQFHDLVQSLFAGAARLPVMPLPASRLQPIDVGEVADRLVELALGEPRGRVRDLAGPEIRNTGDLARAYLRITGKRRPVWTLKLPGKMFRALREGRNIARDPDRGTATFESWLAEGAHR